MKVFIKNIFRNIKFNLIRYVTILLIVMLGVALYAGLVSADGYMRDLGDSYYNDSRFYDAEIASYTGLNRQSAEDIARTVMENTGYTAAVQKSADIRLETDGTAYLIRALQLPDSDGINIVMRDGLPAEALTPGELYIDVKLADMLGTEAGDNMSFSGVQYTVIAGVKSAYYMSSGRGISLSGLSYDGFIYLSGQDMETLGGSYTVQVRKPGDKHYFDDEYKGFASGVTRRIKEVTADYNGLLINSAADNAGRSGYKDDCERIRAISVVFPVLFFLVAALVSLTNMTRLVESDRTRIGLERALGIGRVPIILSYVFFAASATLLGAVPGYFAGINLLPRIIIRAYAVMYNLPSIATPPVASIAALSAGFILLSTVLPTLFAVWRTLAQQPAQLLRPKAPPAGKKILLERLKWLWHRVPFMHKVAVRNIFRYKSRVLLMLVGIAGATALLVIAYGMRESISAVGDKQFGQIIKYDYVIQGMPGEEVYSVLDDEEIAEGYTAAHMMTVKIKDNSAENVFLTVPEDPADFMRFFVLRDADTGENLDIFQDGAVITEQLAKHIGVWTGDTVTLIAGGEELNYVITAVAENYLSHYIFTAQSPNGSGLNTVLVKLREDADAGAVRALSEKLIAMPQVNYVTQLKDDGRKTFEDTINTLSLIILAINLFAMALSFIVMFSLTNISIEERRRELATLKVMGFTDGQAAMYMYRESVVLTVIGALLGCVGGYFLLDYVYTTVENMSFMFVRDFIFSAYLYSFLLVCAFYAAVNFIMFFRIKKTDMVSALKAAE